MPLLSIIIPTLNEEDFLPGLLKSIKLQTFKDYEIIVADAGSKDKTAGIAGKYGCRVVPGGLPAKGRNEGAMVANGNLLLFLDADTKLPHKKFLKKILIEFGKRKLDIAFCPLRPLEKSKFLSQKLLNLLFDIRNAFYVFNEKISPAGVGSFVLIKKSLHRKIKGFNENVHLGEDTLYIKKAAKYGKFGILRSDKIYWSIRRLEKEKWLRVIFLYILCDLLSPDEKKLEIFKKGFLKYHWAHYKKEQTKPKDPLFTHLEKIKKILGLKNF